MNQDLHSCSAHRVEGAEDVQGIGGTEPEDGLALIQHDERLRTETGVRPGQQLLGCVETGLWGTAVGSEP